jgi:hypothetical protein
MRIQNKSILIKDNRIPVVSFILFYHDSAEELPEGVVCALVSVVIGDSILKRPLIFYMLYTYIL